MARKLSMAVVAKLLSKNDLEAEEYLTLNNRFLRVFNTYDVESMGMIKRDKMPEFVNTILRSWIEIFIKNSMKQLKIINK